MSEQTTIRPPRVHRPAASATWEYEHRWGTGLGDTSTLYVDRRDGGSLTIRYHSDSIEVREELVQVLAEMVAAAAAWTDKATS